MSRTKHLKGECHHCGGHLSFPAEGIGMTATCPHCGQETELFLATPRQESTVPVKAIVYTVIALLILGGGTAALLIRLKHEQRIVAEKKQAGATAAATQTNRTSTPPTPVEIAAQAGFMVSAITLEKTVNSSLVHAVGTVTAVGQKRRFGVKLEINLLDSTGQKIGTATDYALVIEPKTVWHFRALVIDSKTVSATLASIKEDP